MSPSRRRYPTETAFRPTVVQAARATGWVCHMIPDWFYRKAMAEGKRKGWRGGYEWPDAGAPDLLIARSGEVVYLELKGEKEDLSPDQVDWIARLRSSGQLVVVIRPQNWDLLREALTNGFRADPTNGGERSPLIDLPDDWRAYEWE